MIPEESVMRARAAVLAFLRTYSVKVAQPGNEFKLASGGRSRLYIDAKRTTLHRQMHQPLGLLLHLEINRFPAVDAVAGVISGGSHLASLVAARETIRGESTLSVIYVRKRLKDHGMETLVDAPWHPVLNERVVVLEDVLSTGGSVSSAIAALREECYTVVGAVTLLDRRSSPLRESTIDGVPLRAVFKLEDLDLHDDVSAVTGAIVRAAGPPCSVCGKRVSVRRTPRCPWCGVVLCFKCICPNILTHPIVRR